jgi:hypothetical protein
MPNLIIAIGGTGKSIALVYLKLAKLFADRSQVLVIDMPFGGESIDRELNEEGVDQSDFITPWPGGTRALGGVTFAEAIGLTRGDVAQPVAHALFADEELNTLVERGMNCRPIVGATIAMRKFWTPQQDAQLDELRDQVGQYNDIFIVGSIAGGTGAGVTPTLARWLTEVCGRQVHGILLLPWIDIGAGAGGGPTNAGMRANAYAVLSYLKQVDPTTNPGANAPFQDYVVIGLPANLDPDTTAISANHPLHLVAATYLLYFDELLRRNPAQRQGPFYLEITAGGLRESDVQPTRGFSLAHAIYRQFWYRDVLNTLARQKPDEAWDVMVPPFVADRLAWRVLREGVREVAITFEAYGNRKAIWERMRSCFANRAEAARRCMEWLETVTSRDTDHLVYDIDWDWLRQQSSGSVRRAHRAAKRIGLPPIKRMAGVLDCAGALSEAICDRVFELLGHEAGSIARGGPRQALRRGQSTVFLPSGVHNPQGCHDIERRPLTNLEALIQQLAGATEVVNMPDPQARRYQFAITLKEALDNYCPSPSKATWDATDALAQFTALVEGVIFGKLKLELYDLQDYGFRSPYERRLLGVLVDNNGNVYGGTDPDTLFFPAPEAWRGNAGALRVLSNNNVVNRNTEAGIFARALLKNFRETFGKDDRPLWLKAIDEYLRIYEPPAGIDEVRLRAGWKQVGPTQLRLPDGSVDARYIPVYQSNFFSLATSALGGEFVPRDDEIYLRVGNSEVGKISYPRTVALGLTQKLMGAGNISILTGTHGQAGARVAQINYEGLRQSCESLIGEVSPQLPNVIDHPFNYPDVVRVPCQHDGFLAEYFLQGSKVNERYGQRFIDAMRGRGIAMPPTLPSGQGPPDAVRDGDYYFIDKGGVAYVEKYKGIEIKELSLLGQALWVIFIGAATQVQGRNMFVDSGGNVILEFNDQRFIPGQHMALDQPDQRMRAADLRGLVYYIDQRDVDALFKEAVKCWLRYFSMNPSPGTCDRRRLDIGGRGWWCP